MEFGHLLEAAMLVCFGFSWPLNVIKAYRARTAKGTSLGFIILIITGYVAGISAKFVNHQINYVLTVYFINLVIVMTNVLVYFRNVRLDSRKASETVSSSSSASSVIAMKKKFEPAAKLNIDLSGRLNEKKNMEEYMNYQDLNALAEKEGVVLFGGSLDREIPVTELAQSFDFNFKIYNRSKENLSLKDAVSFYQTNIEPISPEGVIVHLGDSDISLFQSNSANFDNIYLDLISVIKCRNSKCRLALVSVNNPLNDKVIAELNRHIKAIADSEHCDFINIDNAKLKNPKAIIASVNFVQSLGLNIRKPLRDVADILYSYAYIEIPEHINKVLAG